MKIDTERTNNTVFRCVLKSKDMQAVLSEAAAAAAGIDLKACNVNLMRFGVTGGSNSMSPLEAHVDLVVTHPVDVEGGASLMKPLPPEPPPMRKLSDSRLYWLSQAFFVIFYMSVLLGGIAWCLGAFDMK